MKRIALLLVVLALAVAGCGSSGHSGSHSGAKFLGGAAAHKIINHFVTSKQGRSNVNKLFCIYHGHRVVADVKHKHYVIAGLNAYAAYKACKGGFTKH